MPPCPSNASSIHPVSLRSRPMSRRGFMQLRARRLCDAELAGTAAAARGECARSRNSERNGDHHGVAAGRAVAHRLVRSEAGHRQRVPRAVQDDQHQSARARSSPSCCRCTPRSRTSSPCCARCTKRPAATRRARCRCSPATPTRATSRSRSCPTGCRWRNYLRLKAAGARIRCRTTSA